ncbi:MAG: Crp/Fnr family transcriptional regulator [Candidatus Binatia bacterium]
MSSLATLNLQSRSFHPTATPTVVLPTAPPVRALARKLHALRSLSLFLDAPEPELLRLAEASLLRQFDSRHTIVSGRVRENCIILVEGRAKTVTRRSGTDSGVTLEILESGSILSDLGRSSRSTGPSSETVALERCRVLFLPRRSLDNFLLRNASVALRLLDEMAARLERARESATPFSRLDVGDRLYQRLVELSESRGSARPGGAVLIDLGLHQSELAASIGASRESVNRQFAAWRELGLVECGRCSVIVKDPLGLSMVVSEHLRSRPLSPAASSDDRRHERS